MRIIFFCGALEPGRDGVGDYTRRLAGELSRKGHDCLLIALTDIYIKEMTSTYQMDHDQEMKVLRIPSGNAWSETVALLSKVVKEYNADLLSLQYVAFAYQAKGLPLGLAAKLKKIGGDKSWEVMFHEIWIGLATENTLKERLLGAAQRFLTRYLLQVLKPVIIHTHTTLYKKHLELLGFKPEILPLASNLPIFYPKEVAMKIAKEPCRSQDIRIAVFGGIHWGAPIADFAHDAKTYSIVNNAKLTLVVIGRSSQEQQDLIAVWKANGMPVEVLGQLDEHTVSEVLRDISFGIFTTPIALVEKSSAVATMWGHGVRLLCLSRPWNPRNIQIGENPYHIKTFSSGSLEQFFNKKAHFEYMPTFPKVAEKFIEHFNINHK